EVLEYALQFHEGFLQEDSANPQVRCETAQAYLQVGDIRRALGRSAEAEKAFRRALEVCEQLVADFPDESAYRRRLAQSCTWLGNLLVATGRPEEAGPFYQRFHEMWVRWPDHVRNERASRQALAAYHHNQAHHHSSLARLKEAESHYRTAVSLQEQLAREYPETEEYLRGLARSHNGLGVTLKRTGRPGDAAAAYRRPAHL